MLDTKQELRIDPRTTVGAVTLGVQDLTETTRFYNEAIGLDVISLEDRQVRLGVDEQTLVVLEHRPDGRAYHNAPGLYHLALLLPSRADLGLWLDQYSRKGLRLTGVADHLVSEALYLNDPEGNGIEIYRDRPREDWPHRDGELLMDTLALDVYKLLEDAAKTEFNGMSEGTKMGHIHLKVNDLPRAQAFYQDVVGFDFMLGMPTAGFMSAGGYHHHLGMNTWHSLNVQPRPKDALGLISYQIVLPDAEAFDGHLANLEKRGAQIDLTGEHPQLVDPSGNVIEFVSA